jgi:hypothetical protein
MTLRGGTFARLRGPALTRDGGGDSLVRRHSFRGSKSKGSWSPTLFAISQTMKQTIVYASMLPTAIRPRKMLDLTLELVLSDRFTGVHIQSVYYQPDSPSPA